jgi:hypothetical protein
VVTTVTGVHTSAMTSRKLSPSGARRCLSIVVPPAGDRLLAIVSIFYTLATSDRHAQEIR